MELIRWNPQITFFIRVNAAKLIKKRKRHCMFVYIMRKAIQEQIKDRVIRPHETKVFFFFCDLLISYIQIWRKK